MNWRTSAACRQADPELFFPVGNGGTALMRTQQAKAVCRTCPVQEPCLDWALRTGEAAGVWGGTTPEERQELRTRRIRRARSRDQDRART